MKEELIALKARYVKAKNDTEKEKIDREMQKLINSDPDGFAKTMAALAKETADRAEAMVVKEKLKEVLPILSLSYIAKTYFNKTRQWLYQRINGNMVNGKQAEFTKSELDILRSALRDISRITGSVSL